MNDFSGRLKALRRKRQLTQSELANHIGMSKSSINMYERGEREPGLDTLAHLADFFAVDLDYLLGRGGETGREDSVPLCRDAQQYRAALLELRAAQHLCIRTMYHVFARLAGPEGQADCLRALVAALTKEERQALLRQLAPQQRE